MVTERWSVSPDKLAKAIMTFPSRRYYAVHDKRPCSCCSKIGITIEVLLGKEDPHIDRNINSMEHFGAVCWGRVKRELKALGEVPIFTQ